MHVPLRAQRAAKGVEGWIFTCLILCRWVTALTEGELEFDMKQLEAPERERY